MNHPLIFRHSSDRLTKKASSFIAGNYAQCSPAWKALMKANPNMKELSEPVVDAMARMH